MIKTTVFSLSTALALTVAAQATTVSLSAGFTGPFVEDSDGVRVNGGLMLLGHIDAAGLATIDPSSDIAAITAVFQEFGTANTNAQGSPASSFTNVTPAADGFNDKQIYLWILDTDSKATATEHGLYTVADPTAPATGNNWIYPVNAGGVGDSTSISVAALIDGPAAGLPGGSEGRNLRLMVIPEPSGAMLAGVAGLALLFRRRR